MEVATLLILGIAGTYAISAFIAISFQKILTDNMDRKSKIYLVFGSIFSIIFISRIIYVALTIVYRTMRCR